MAIYPYTLKELYDNYEFKVTKRMLLKEYPWIKNVTVDPEQLEKYNTIFLNFDIDPVKLGEQMGWTMTPWAQNAYDNNKEYHGIYLSIIYDNVNYNDTVEVVDELEKLIESVNKSPAIPKDLKLKGTRSLSIGSFYINQGNEPWF